VEIRAALAWGQLPTILGAVIGLVVALILLGTGALGSSLLTAIAVAASLWTLIVTWLMFARVQEFGFWRAVFSATIGWLSSLLVLLLVAVVIRGLLFQPFNTPSSSMLPTLRVGDYFFVSKWPYGFSRYSFYNLIPFNGRILPAEPKRGDVVVFKLPRDNSIDYVKRVIGLPGDEITVRGGVLIINGTEVPRERIADFVTQEDTSPRPSPAYEETLPNGVKYTVLDSETNGPFDNVGPYKVPAGHYFMMGDNRDNSTDSRLLDQVGYVPFENLLGRAALLFSMSRDRFGITVR
jgi:signal peptidase I